ncbi:enhancer of mRNA-decapping protein 4-like isoform X2 [Homarus americanus]|nr:enhancer of mRNA-decapping protein 4-like isoform X2 [Homarus americanus]XP_042204510.1 enhancer of mRNA-decapping protein 4-like isoform X2 [Homarus americanus]
MEAAGYKEGASMLQALMKTTEQGQTISFRGNDEQCSSALFSSEVKVEVGITDHTSGSSAITTRNITNYPWDHHYLSGSLVVQHCTGDYLAYAIKAPQKSSGMVRIIHCKSGNRGLVKNIRGMLRDLAFAHLSNRVVLAFTDQFGTLYVCEVTESTTEGTLNTEMLLEVNSGTDKASDYHRVIWCPYIPDEQGSNDDGDDPAYLLVLTHGPCAEIWNVGVVLQEYGGGQLRRDQVVAGYQLMEQHSAPITDAAFSPDGTALATAALDGYVKFFQVYMADEEKSPRCLHQWNPHDGKPLSALFFLDNHKHHSPDVQFWKYAVTGACNNSELRVWSCESWQCHQTLRFVPAPEAPPQTSLTFKAAMDPSANFLLLSDIHRRVMYVIVVYQDGISGSGCGGGTSGLTGAGGTFLMKNGGGGGGIARLVSVSELPVQYPTLSLSITDAAWKPYKRWKHDHAHDHSQNAHDDDDDDDNDGGDNVDVVDGVVMRCVLINTKSLQEATLRFQPATPLTGHSNIGSLDLSASQDSIVVRDGLTDLSMSLSTSVSEVEGTVSGDGGGVEEQPPPPPLPDALTSPQSSSLSSQHSTLQTPTGSQPAMNLLTPDSFSSPRKPEDSDHAEDGSEDGSIPNKVTPVPTTKFDVPFEEFAALSLLLRCGSGNLMPCSDSENNSGLSILGSVVAGSSKSPPSAVLPPPPSGTPSPQSLQDKVDAPLATSEAAVSTAVGRVGTSATSSPSLEVQQILHSENGKSEDYADDDEDMQAGDEVEMAEDDDDEEEEEEDEDEEEEEEEVEERESHQQSHSHPPPPPPPSMPEPQPMPQPPPSLVKPPTSIPLPPPSLPQPSPPPPSMPQPPVSMPQPPVSLQELPVSMPQPPVSMPQPPVSMPQPPVSMPQPPVSMPQPPVSMPQPPVSMPQPPVSLQELPASLQQSPSSMSQSVPQLLNTLPQLSLRPAHLPRSSPPQQPPTHDAQQTTSQPLDIFASVKSVKTLPAQLTCAQLEAEIKGEAVTSDSSGSSNSSTHQSNLQSKRPRNCSSMNCETKSTNRCAPDVRNPGCIDQNQFNGPITPEVSAADIADLKNLMVTCVNLNREQNKEVMTQTRMLTSKLDTAILQVNQLAKQVEEMKSAQAQVQMEVPHIVAASLRPLVESTLRTELRGTVLPGVVKSLEPLQSHVSQEMQGLLKTAEGQVIDSVSKIIHTRSFLDNLVGSLSSVLVMTVQNSCREAYTKILLPGLNALTQQIFTQVNDNFSRGTREYLQNLESEVQGGRTAVQEVYNKAAQSLNSSCTSLNTQSKSLQENITKLTAQQNVLTESLSERIRGLVREEVTHALQEHQAIVDARSRAHTPAPTSHTLNPKVAQQQVQALISQGQFNAAFKQALSASDLSLVVFVCERVNPQQVFNMTPCPLSQDVLLSLVNQLSHDLSTFTDLKIKYLEEAVMNLDASHPVTCEHMRPVLQGFQRNLHTYLSANPNHKKVKMLLMAVNHLVAL